MAHLLGTGFPKTPNLAKQIDGLLGVEQKKTKFNPNHRPVAQESYDNVYSGKNTGAQYLAHPTSPEAKKGAGWATALKPGVEDWWLVRKPIQEKTIAANILLHGTGGLNIDGTRLITDDKLTRKLPKSTVSKTGWKSSNRSAVAGKDGGRWPPNVILSTDDLEYPATQRAGASKFFYTQKPGRAEKEGNHHPTVKSIALMITIITPPGGTVLEPFMGSGTTGVAAKKLGHGFIGIEQEDDYYKVAC